MIRFIIIISYIVFVILPIYWIGLVWNYRGKKSTFGKLICEGSKKLDVTVVILLIVLVSFKAMFTIGHISRFETFIVYSIIAVLWTVAWAVRSVVGTPVLYKKCLVVKGTVIPWSRISGYKLLATGDKETKELIVHYRKKNGLIRISKEGRARWVIDRICIEEIEGEMKLHRVVCNNEED